MLNYSFKSHWSIEISYKSSLYEVFILNLIPNIAEQIKLSVTIPFYEPTI